MSNPPPTERPEEREREMRSWLAEGGHLPAPLRDFHDQKDVFKSLHEWIGQPSGSHMVPLPSWIAGHVYIVDYFLRFMAAHGWTLQRTRRRGEYASLSETIKERRDREASIMRDWLTRRPPTGKPSVDTPNVPADVSL